MRDPTEAPIEAPEGRELPLPRRLSAILQDENPRLFLDMACDALHDHVQALFDREVSAEGVVRVIETIRYHIGNSDTAIEWWEGRND